MNKKYEPTPLSALNQMHLLEDLTNFLFKRRKDPTSLGKAEALAKIMLAAPDLLEACKAVSEWCDLIEQNYPEMTFTKAIRAAIAKAEGPTS